MVRRVTVRPIALTSVALVGVPLALAVPAVAEDSPTTLQGITLVDTRPGMPGGYTELRL